MEQKICVICKKKFVPYAGDKQKCCSPECSVKNSRKYTKEYSSDPYNIERRHLLYRERTKNSSICKICGKPTTMLNQNKAQYHTECIFNEAVEVIKSGGKLTNAQGCRLRLRGFSVKEIKKLIKEEGNKNEFDCNKE